MWILDTRPAAHVLYDGKGQWILTHLKAEAETLLTKWFTDAIQAQWSQLIVAELEQSGPIYPKPLSDRFDVEVSLRIRLVPKPGPVAEPTREAAP